MIRDYSINDNIYLDKYYKDVFGIIKKYDEDTNYIKVYEIDKTIIGFIDYSILYERAELNYIYVLDEYKRKGYAFKLMEYMFNDLKKHNVLSITLEVNVNNIKAINLYKKMNFEVINIRKKYYKNSEDGYLMYREVK